MYKDTYIFPAVVTQTKSDNYSAYFPDLPGCITGGDTAEELFYNLKEALSLHLYGMEEDGDEIPQSSNLKDVICEHGYFCVLAEADMKLFRRLQGNKNVNRVITLPAWLNEEIKRSGVNLSQLTQKALKEYLGV